MGSVRDVVLVLAGAQAFHTVSHLVLGVCVELPLQMKMPRMALTSRMNTVVIIINAVVTIGLFWWASRL